MSNILIDSYEDPVPIEEIRCINCGELNYLREDRPSGESEKCQVCGKSLHLKAEQVISGDMSDINDETHLSPCIDSWNPLLNKKLSISDIKREHLPHDCICYQPLAVECEHTTMVVGSEYCLTLCKHLECHYAGIGVVVCSAEKEDPGTAEMKIIGKLMVGDVDLTPYVKKVTYTPPKEGHRERINLESVQYIDKEGFTKLYYPKPQTEVTELINGEWVTRKDNGQI